MNTSYIYDETGNKTSMPYPDNTTIEHGYDLLGRMTDMLEAEGQYTSYHV